MSEAASQSALILPLACGLLAAVGFAAVLLRFRSRGDGRDPTLPTANGPPGWLTPDSAPPPAPPQEQSSIDKIAEGKVEILPSHIFGNAQRMKDQGASPEDIFKMMHEAFGGTGGNMQQQVMRTVVENFFGNDAGKPGFSFAANVSMSTSGGMHETLNMDKETFAKVRDMQAQGMTLDHICNDIDPEYKGWEPAHQERYRNLMRTVLAFSGIHVRDI